MMAPPQHVIASAGLRLWRRIVTRLQTALNDGIRYAEPNMTAIGTVGVIGFPLFGWVWTVPFPQPYENLPLRLLGSALLLPLMLIHLWPAAWRRFLPAYWLAAMLFALPFFFTFMLLQNGMSTVWGMSTMAALFLLVLLVPDWLLVVLLFLTGTALAWLAHWLVSPGPPGVPESYLEQLPIYLFVILGGSVFNYKADVLSRERLDAMLAVSRNIAHELRTPLLGIRSGAGGLKRFLPRLLTGYRQALDSGLDVPRIRTGHLASLGKVLDRIEQETAYAGTMVDMLLVNAGRHRLEPASFEPTAIGDCVQTALRRYPFRSAREREHVHWRCDTDFVFNGSSVLMMHVVFNLLRNALQALAEAGRGEVVIRAHVQGHEGRLTVRDTGIGIAPDTLPRIFERFYTSRGVERGAGIGLSFCRMVMEGFGGTIRCRSEHGRFTEFTLAFPGATVNG
jgi:two-component system CAI-1 autoinducer sensor kinase/phosphatase CqsS